ncbi:MAG: hypothetical protein LUI87_13970 [Lachnospiraceae bacterium]|nr:hypothetical protein [Lachnospiraceae bacterium]
MSEFSIMTDKGISLADLLDGQAAALENAAGSVDSIRSNLSIQGTAKTSVMSAMKTISTAVRDESTAAAGLGKALREIASAYSTAESSILGSVSAAVGNGAGTGSGAGAGGSEENQQTAEQDEEESYDWGKLLLKLVGNAGILGSGTAMIASWLTGGSTAKDVLSLLKDFTGFAGGIAKAVPNSGESFDWKALVGVDAAVKTTTPTSWLGDKGTLNKELSKLKFSNAETASEKVACAAKWAGYTLTAVITGYDNFTDPDNTTFSRRLAETVGETAVKIGEGILVKTAITAGLAALGCVGAPAIAVGVASVAVIELADVISTKLTGKDVAEFVSDTVIDGTKAVVKGVGNAVKSAGKAVSGWWDSMTTSFSGALSW